jgi:hypothetical protein
MRYVDRSALKATLRFVSCPQRLKMYNAVKRKLSNKWQSKRQACGQALHFRFCQVLTILFCRWVHITVLGRAFASFLLDNSYIKYACSQLMLFYAVFKAKTRFKMNRAVGTSWRTQVDRTWLWQYRILLRHILHISVDHRHNNDNEKS